MFTPHPAPSSMPSSSRPLPAVPPSFTFPLQSAASAKRVSWCPNSEPGLAQRPRRPSPRRTVRTLRLALAVRLPRSSPSHPHARPAIARR